MRTKITLALSFITCFMWEENLVFTLRNRGLAKTEPTGQASMWQRWVIDTTQTIINQLLTSKASITLIIFVRKISLLFMHYLGTLVSLGTLVPDRVGDLLLDIFWSEKL